MSDNGRVVKNILNDLVPLNLCVKYKPPSIALHYKLNSNPEKKYIHVIKVAHLLKQHGEANEMYEKLLLKEPAYLNPKVISRKQIIKLIEQLYKKAIPLEENDKKHDKIPPEKSPKALEEDKEAKISVESTGVTSPVLASNLPAALPADDNYEDDYEPEEFGKNIKMPANTNKLNDEVEDEMDKILKREFEAKMKANKNLQPDPNEEDNDSESANQAEKLNAAEMEELMKKRPDLRQAYEEMLSSIFIKK